MYEQIHQRFQQDQNPEALFLHLLSAAAPVVTEVSEVTRKKVAEEMARCQDESEFKRYFYSFVLLCSLLDDQSREQLMAELAISCDEYPFAMRNTALALINRNLDIAPRAIPVLTTLSNLLFE